MKDELNLIILKETEAIEALLRAMESQHTAIIKKDVFKMEEMVAIIGKCNRDVASFEFERRNITKGKPMSEILQDFNDDELDDNVRKIQKLLHATITQKNNNELLIKQGLAFTNKILNVLNPDRTAKTYNAYGRVKR
jgi:flagellar biosynthesis/type III secretory pathway chaperone